jgi:uncharacterized hydrophobic protein (TIGR00271 family)
MFFDKSLVHNLDNVLFFTTAGLLIACIFSLIWQNHSNNFFTILIFTSFIIVLVTYLLAPSDPDNSKLLLTENENQLWKFVAYAVPGLWGVSLLLDFKGTIPKLKKNFPVTIIIINLCGLLGAGLILTKGYSPNFLATIQLRNTGFSEVNTPLLANLGILLSGMVVLLGALIGILNSFSKTILFLFQERLIPRKTLFIRDNDSINWSGLVIIFIASLIISILLPYWLLLSLSSIGFLWFTVLLNASEFQNLNIKDRNKNNFYLPFHPLIPGLALVISFLLSLTLPIPAILIFLIWLGVGFLAYKFFYLPNVSVIRERSSKSESVSATDDTKSDVLVILQDPYSAISLIKAGSNLAKNRTSRLLIIQPISISAALPETYRRQEAQNQLSELFEYIERSAIDPEIPVIPIVDIVENLESSILDLVDEENIGLVVLNLKQDDQKKDLDRIWNKLLDSEVVNQHTGKQNCLDVNKILRNLSCDVIVFRGRYDGGSDRIIIPIIKFFPLQAYKFGLEITKNKNAPIIFLNTTQNSISLSQNRDLEPIFDSDRINIKNFEENNLKEAVKTYTQPDDLVLIETDLENFFDAELFTELMELFQTGKQKATILVRSSNKLFRIYLHRAWFFARNLFPTLSASEKISVSTKIREAARPSADYFVLIILAASIATLGLLADSTAVIIGAMLVAPLMSPIISTALGIVQGDTFFIKLSVEASLKGIALAIGVGALMTIIFPDPLTTNEIFARTHPNLLDLFVALASGAAAGYALARENVSAALPGVAIAVALVPPLCVVGYGIATTDFHISGGAFLLFITNVVAIILAAAVVFLLLGFRPTKYQDSLFQSSILIFVVSLVIISIPLTFFLFESIQNTTIEQNERLFSEQVEIFLENEIQKENGDLLDLELEQTDNGYLLNAIILVPEEYGNIRFSVMENLLEQEFNKNIKLNARIIDAKFVR